MKRQSALLDLGWVLRTLHTPGAVQGAEEERFLRDSYDDAPGFLSALVAAAPLPLPRKSDLQTGIDLWSDLVAAWSDHTSERLVLRCYDALCGWQPMSYGELATQALALSQVLEERGAGPGDLLLLLLPMGPDFLVGFCAALRIGMQIASLPPQAPGLLAAQIARLNPHTIYTAPRCRRLLSNQVQPFVLPTRAVQSARHKLTRELQSPALSSSSSHTYAVDEPLLQLCSQLAAGGSVEPVTVSAGAAYGGALRDALHLGLYTSEPSDRWRTSSVQLMAPDMHLTQHVPSVLLATLTAGATLVEVNLVDAERDPSLWLRGGVSVHHVLLTPDLQVADLQTLLSCAASGGLLDLRRLLVCPFLARTRLPDRSFSAWLGHGHLAAVVASQIHLDSASGGVVLYSDPQRGGLASALHPALGCRHRIEDPGRPGQSSLQGAGRLRILSTPAAADGELLVSRLPVGYFLGGTLTPRRRGRSFLCEPLLAFLRERRIGYEHTIVTQAGQPDAEFHLLLFVGTDATTKSAEEGLSRLDLTELRTEISVTLGPLALPDRISVLPIHPRMRGAVLDRLFYQSSHDTGVLPRLCHDPALRSLSTLRGLLRHIRGTT